MASTDDLSQDSLYDPADLETLMQLGFPEDLAIQALVSNDSVDAAIEWIVQGSDTHQNASESLTVKMVLVVRSDLGMSAGKVAAQCVHAALGAYRLAAASNAPLMAVWEDSGEKTVCLRCKDEAEIHELQNTAVEAGLVNYLVTDAGRTEILSGSETVLAIGPGPEQLVNTITGHLKLY